MVRPRSAASSSSQTRSACRYAAPSARRARLARRPEERRPAASCSQASERSRRKAVASTRQGSPAPARQPREPRAERDQRLQARHHQLEHAVARRQADEIGVLDLEHGLVDPPAERGEQRAAARQLAVQLGRRDPARRATATSDSRDQPSSAISSNAVTSRSRGLSSSTAMRLSSQASSRERRVPAAIARSNNGWIPPSSAISTASAAWVVPPGLVTLRRRISAGSSLAAASAPLPAIVPRASGRRARRAGRSRSRPWPGTRSRGTGTPGRRRTSR